MRRFVKVDNCGPVTYPNDRRKSLTTETVEGDEWLPLLALGYIRELPPEPEVAKVKTPPVISKPVETPKSTGAKPPKDTGKKSKGNATQKRGNIASNDVQASSGEIVNDQAHEREGTAGLDPQATGRSEPEGSTD